MSAAAGEYFAALSSRYEIEAPEILNGEPLALIDPARRLSIHLADSVDHQGLPREIREATTAKVEAIGEFLMRAAEVEYPTVLYVGADDTQLRSGVYPGLELLKALTPAQKKLSTGHFRNFIAEVITPEEVPENIHDELMHMITGNARYPRRLTGFMAYLMTTAELYSGRRIGKLGNISCVAATGHGEASDELPFSKIIDPPMTVSRPLTVNEMTAVAALRESQARAYSAKSRALRHPYSGGLMH